MINNPICPICKKITQLNLIDNIPGTDIYICNCSILRIYIDEFAVSICYNNIAARLSDDKCELFISNNFIKYNNYYTNWQFVEDVSFFIDINNLQNLHERLNRLQVFK